MTDTPLTCPHCEHACAVGPDDGEKFAKQADEPGGALMLCSNCARPFICERREGRLLLRPLTREETKAGGEALERAAYNVSAHCVWRAVVKELRTWSRQELLSKPRVGVAPEGMFVAADLSDVADRVGLSPLSRRLVDAALSTKVKPSLFQFLAALQSIPIPFDKQPLSLEGYQAVMMQKQGEPGEPS